MMPIMVLTANMSPKNIEATFYSFVTAIMNLAYMISYQFSGALIIYFNITSTNFKNLTEMVILIAIYPFMGLILMICLLPK